MHALVCICPFAMSTRFFFFNDTATTEIYTLSLHDALPISHMDLVTALEAEARAQAGCMLSPNFRAARSEEHTSELQSPYDLVCRLLLEKKKKNTVLLPCCEARKHCAGQHSCRRAADRTGWG